MTAAADNTIPLDEPYARAVLASILVDRISEVTSRAEGGGCYVWEPCAPIDDLIFGDFTSAEAYAMACEEIGRIGAMLRAVLDPDAHELQREGLSARDVVQSLREYVGSPNTGQTDEETDALAAAIPALRKFVDRYLPAEAVA